jgi:lysozyme family protein
MSDSNIAIAATLVHEGGYVDNPADPGGATNMGVEQRDTPNIPIRTLTVAQAESYYRVNYWKPLYSQIVDQAVASKLFDFGVLFGVGTAVKCLQGVLCIAQDGNFGPDSLYHVNTASQSVLLGSYKTAMLAHAAAVVASNPRLSVFLAGWDNRINS